MKAFYCYYKYLVVVQTTGSTSSWRYLIKLLLSCTRSDFVVSEILMPKNVDFLTVVCIFSLINKLLAYLMS